MSFFATCTQCLEQNKQELDQRLWFRVQPRFASRCFLHTFSCLQVLVVLCEQIRVIDKRRVLKVRGHLDEESLEKVRTALLTIPGL